MFIIQVLLLRKHMMMFWTSSVMSDVGVAFLVLKHCHTTDQTVVASVSALPTWLTLSF